MYDFLHNKFYSIISLYQQRIAAMESRAWSIGNANKSKIHGIASFNSTILTAV